MTLDPMSVVPPPPLLLQVTDAAVEGLNAGGGNMVAKTSQGGGFGFHF